MKNLKGLTFVELIIFIIILGIISANLLLPNLLKRSATPQQIFTASQIATECAEWFAGQRKMNGFSSITCGSTVPSFCAQPSSSTYHVTTNVNCSLTNYDVITITVSGAGSANLKLELANY